MREIKFRAWTGSEMLTDIAVMGDGSSEVVIFQSSSDCQIIYNCIVMQYTGLLDKNGEEIYEGDVVQVFYDGHPQEAGHEAYTVVIEDMVKSQFGGVGNGNGEVIGNIYENPELLT